MKTQTESSSHIHSVRIAFRGPKISEHNEKAGENQELAFLDTETASDWVAMHIPENERRFVKMWIGNKPITGATLDATLRPFSIETEDEGRLID